jgi:hypothetical protein
MLLIDIYIEDVSITRWKHTLPNFAWSQISVTQINVYNITAILPELSGGPDIYIQIVMKYVPTNDVYRLQLNVCIQDE